MDDTELKLAGGVHSKVSTDKKSGAKASASSSSSSSGGRAAAASMAIDYDDFKSNSSVAAAAAAAITSADTEFRVSRVLARSAVDTESFLIKEKSFERQFAAIYFNRLQCLKASLKAAAKSYLEKWRPNDTAAAIAAAAAPNAAAVFAAAGTLGSSVSSAVGASSSSAAAGGGSSSGSSTGATKPILCEKTLDLTRGTPSIIIGTLYKEMKYKPCILDEYAKERGVDQAVSIGPTLCAPDDSLVLEDEYGRVGLSGTAIDLPVAALVTGMVVAVVGAESEQGLFHVSRVLFPELPLHPHPLPIVELKEPARYVLFVSGLSFGEPTHDPLPTQMLCDYISGMLGGSNEQKFASHIVRVVIAGDALYRTKDKPLEFTAQKKLDRANKLKVLSPLKELDMFLTQIASSVKVDIMPGADDPSNFSLPQQPMHPCIFPSSRTYSTFSSVTNPSKLTTQGVIALGTSGQNIDDLLRYSSIPTPLDGLEYSLRWRNVAPTAPDTLGCYPFQDTDPFIITECPHIYFAGNQKAYDTRVVSGANGQNVRLIAIPSFAKTGTAVLCNLNNLQCSPLKFEVPAHAQPQPTTTAAAAGVATASSSAAASAAKK